MILTKQVNQARLLGKCLAGLLAMNLLVVGLSFWTGLSRASVEAQGIAETSQSAPAPVVSDAAKLTDAKAAEPVKVAAPTPIQANSPEKTVAAAPKSTSAPPSTSVATASTLEPAIGETTPTREPPVTRESGVPPIKIPASPDSPQPAVIRLVNPGDTGGDVHYAVNRMAYTLSPGECHEISTEGEMFVEFHRGGDFGYSKLPLQPGDYQFGVGDAGWNLSPALLDPAAAPHNAP